MKTLPIAVIALAAAAAAAQSFEYAQPPLTLVESGTVGAPNNAVGFYQPVMCDDSGNIYLRVALNLGSDTNPVWKLSASGEKVAEFNLPAEIGRAYSPDFHVSPDGQFYQNAHGDSGVFLLRYGRDGKFSDHIRIEAPNDFEPGPFAVFADGRILLSGAQRRGKDAWFSMIAIFGADGRLVRWLDFSKPGEPQKPIPKGPVELQVAMGSDGNAYLLNGAEVIVLAPSGEIQRTIAIERPPGNFFIGRIDISGGVLSATIKEIVKGYKVALRFRTYDLLTGEVLADYVPDPNLGNGQICYSANEGYLFWKVGQKRPKLVRAKPR